MTVWLHKRSLIRGPNQPSNRNEGTTPQQRPIVDHERRLAADRDSILPWLRKSGSRQTTSPTACHDQAHEPHEVHANVALGGFCLPPVSRARQEGAEDRQEERVKIRKTFQILRRPQHARSRSSARKPGGGKPANRRHFPLDPRPNSRPNRLLVSPQHAERPRIREKHQAKSIHLRTALIRRHRAYR